MTPKNDQIQPQGLPPPELREIFRRKLRHAVTMIGSVKLACELIGVNRTQFNRYLSGQSMPRPELLYQFCQRLSLPMEWFFDPSEEYAEALSEHEFGTQMRQMVAGHRFRISHEMMPDGFYILWKGMFDAAWDYEAILCVLKTRNGVRTLKVSVLRRLKASDDIFDIDPADFNIELAVFRSSNGIFMMSMEGDHNHVRTFFIRLRAPTLARSTSIIFSGVGLSGAFGGLSKNSLVPVAIEKVPSDNTEDILNAARAVRGYSSDELPRHIRAILEDVNAPLFSLN